MDRKSALSLSSLICTPTVSAHKESAWRTCFSSGSNETIIFKTGILEAILRSVGMWSGVVNTMESEDWLML